MTVIHLPPRKRLAERLMEGRKRVKAHVVSPVQAPRDPETWARRKMDDALTIYREMFGAAALHARLQLALEETTER
jgi:hypothetical protein